MTRDQQREAITCPPAVFGAKMTPQLVQRLLTDVGEDPNRLPILQHALMRTWDYWKQHADESEPIDVNHYDNDKVGGMAEALSKHAEDVYMDLPDDASRTIAEKLFKALTDTAQGNREIRRPAKLKEICDITQAKLEDASRVVEAFRAKSCSFLMPSPSPSVPLLQDTLIDISHESLIRYWKRLKIWATEEAQSEQAYRRLVDAAHRHERGVGSLWRDLDLSAALTWKRDNNPNLAWARRYTEVFIEDDINASEEEKEKRCAEDYDKAMAFLALSRIEFEKEQNREKQEHKEKLERERRFAHLREQQAEVERKREEEARLRAEAQTALEEQARRAAEFESEADQKRAELKAAANRKLRVAVVALIIMFSVAVATSVYAIKLRSDAVRSAAEAVHQAESHRKTKLQRCNWKR